ncbi:MAG: hypothetical protein BWK74_07320, partial [Desulfobacteraceae bacterium A6]
PEKIGKVLSEKFSQPVSPEKPYPNIFLQIRIAGFIAGLGEIGYSKMFLTPEFGPRQRLAALITDLELEPDPIFAGGLCDKCMGCVKECNFGAIPHIRKGKVVKIKVAGREIEWADIDMNKCWVGFMWPKEEYNPFMVTDEDKTMCDKGGRGWDSKVTPLYVYARAFEGARGCIRACMIHLEQQGKLKNKFKEPFRKRKPWKL